MDLGARVPALLAHCAGRALSDAQVAAVARAAVAAVASGARAEEALGADAADSAPLRESLAGIATLVAEAARLSLTPVDLKATLRDEFAFPEPRAAAVASAYEAGSAALRATLLRTAAASAVPRLVGCAWRADHTVAGSHDRAAPPPSFSLTLHTASPAAAAAGAAPAAPDGAISLQLSLEQMQHLALSLKDALRAAEREAAAA